MFPSCWGESISRRELAHRSYRLTSLLRWPARRLDESCESHGVSSRSECWPCTRPHLLLTSCQGESGPCPAGFDTRIVTLFYEVRRLCRPVLSLT